MVEAFDPTKISKSPAIFDMPKLTWMNGEYLRKRSLHEFHTLALPYLKRGIVSPHIDLFEVSKLLYHRIDRLSDIPGEVDFIDHLPDYSVELFIHKKMKTNPDIAKTSLQSLLPELKAIIEWNGTNIRQVVFDIIELLAIKNGQVLWPFRVALSGKQYTPGGGIELAEILGKQETLKRMEHALTCLY